MGGTRPFGISVFVAGVNNDKEPRLYMTEPSGSFTSWKANAIGKNSKSLREFLEKNHKDDLSNEEVIRLGVETMLEVVENEKNIEIALMDLDAKTTIISEERIQAIVEDIKKAKEDAK
jgi:20S proteasome alpha/beta subunit